MATETPARNARDARLRATSDVSVIIPTYTERRREFLARTIASVRAQTRAPLEILVVVDRNERLLGQLRDLLPGVLCVANRHWPGAGARGIRVRWSRMVRCWRFWTTMWSPTAIGSSDSNRC